MAAVIVGYLFGAVLVFSRREKEDSKIKAAILEWRDIVAFGFYLRVWSIPRGVLGAKRGHAALFGRERFFQIRMLSRHSGSS